MRLSALSRLTENPEEFHASHPDRPSVHHGDPAWARSLLS
jgi:hypothetical protein